MRPRASELQAGARQSAPVDAVMRVKARILIGEQHRDIARVDFAELNRQAPAPVGQGEGAQQASVAIDDDGRSLARRHQIDRAEILKILRPCRRDGERQNENQRPGDAEPAALAVHFAMTSIAPKAVRPNRSGRYMSSTVAGG